MLLVKRGQEVFAVGATCTHYSGPLAEGLIVGDTVRCPLHHACFSLRVRAKRWRLRRSIRIACFGRSASAASSCSCSARSKRSHHRGRERGEERALGGGDRRRRRGGPRGGGDAAARGLHRAAHAARRRRVTPRRSPEPVQGLFGRHGARRMDPAASARVLRVAEDRFGARRARDQRRRRRKTRSSPTAAKPTNTARSCSPPAPSRCGSALPAPSCRTCVICARWTDSRAIIERLGSAKRAVVLGSGFHRARSRQASLKKRGLEVHVVSPDTRPLEKVLGPELGDFIRALHEQNGRRLSPGQAGAEHRRETASRCRTAASSTPIW